MSTSDVSLSCENLNSTSKIHEKPTGLKVVPMDEQDEKLYIKNQSIHVYDKEKLLDLRSAPRSLQKPDCLREDFFNKDGVWDPESWHKSNSSRSASPAVDGKFIVVEGKKVDSVDDDIELAPHRRSFRQGCQVQADADKSEKITTRANFERKNRLTGRAAGQRRTLETNYNSTDNSEAISERSKEFEKMRRDREKFYDKDEKAAHRNRFNEKDGDRYFERDRFSRDDFRKGQRDRADSFENVHPRHQSNRNEKVTHLGVVKKSKQHEHSSHENDNLPEWMTDGPDVEDFTVFGDLEEEKKAYARSKKKVRISPNVETQVIDNEKHGVRKNSKEGNKKTKGVKSSDVKDSSNSKNSFDINEFLNGVDYYPPHKFPEDRAQWDGTRSRFTQWFQAQQSLNGGQLRSDGSRPGSGTLIPNEVITGVSPKSPVSSVPYFTPIQPAPALVSAAANAHAVQTSNILSIIHQQKKTDTMNQKEIKGRLSLNELEKSEPTEIEASGKQGFEDNSNTAFDMLIMSMKVAGQLPDKPAPVVSGLPDHLLPQPPKRTSPAFEKLRRSLSRSPSPVQLMNAVSTVASILQNNPTLETKIELLNPDEKPNVIPAEEETMRYDNSTVNESVQEQKRIQTAFTPTSVLKKLHNEKQRESPIPMAQLPPDVSFVEPKKSNIYPDLLNNSIDVGQLRISDESKQYDNFMTTPDRSSNLLFHSAPVTPRNQLNLAPGAPPHSISVPTTPDRFHNEPPPIHRMTAQPTRLSPGSSGSAFTPTKTHDSVLIPPSAFLSSKTKDIPTGVGVIGSGAPQRSNTDLHRFSSDNLDRHRGFADPRLAPGNGASRSTRPFNDTPSQGDPSLAPGNPLRTNLHSTPMPQHQGMPQSQQQQLLHAQRMAQIQQAQMQQQQKLQQIANQANHQKLQQLQQHMQGKQFPGSSGVGPLLPDPDATNQQQRQQELRNAGEQRLHQQQQQRQQIQAYQQQQQTQQQMFGQHKNQQAQSEQVQQRPNSFANTTNNFPNTSNNFSNAGSGFRGRSFQAPSSSRNSPPIPMPMQQPGLPFQSLNHQQGLQNLAAQALVQQQLLTRARFIAQAQLLQQQPRVVQAALMAQAAIARGQAQAQAAMMLNPRNIQVMAEQMGIRPPHNNKAIPTPMVPGNQNLGSMMNVSGNTQSPSNNILSKWFTPDVLQKMPQNKPLADPVNGRILSVEELEKSTA